MSKRKIEPRDGLEVFVNEGGTISIKQDDILQGEDRIIVVHLDDIDTLVGYLQDAKQEAAEINAN